MWQKGQSAPFLQPSSRKAKAQGLHLPFWWRAEPCVRRSGAPAAGGRGSEAAAGGPDAGCSSSTVVASEGGLCVEPAVDASPQIGICCGSSGGDDFTETLMLSPSGLPSAGASALLSLGVADGCLARNSSSSSGSGPSLPAPSICAASCFSTSPKAAQGAHGESCRMKKGSSASIGRRSANSSWPLTGVECTLRSPRSLSRDGDLEGRESRNVFRTT
mmetsp:Transcript_29140/g.90814  ORF Transcript_29140/g.90814 Transcript_29140/m.90814 type:complete len:217 (-) Transcript_29140:496-1146(-)